MPTFEYRCGTCNHRAEERHGMTAAALSVCPACGAPAYRKVPTAPAAVVVRASAASRGRPLTAPYVTHERDGSETVYASTGEAYVRERERTGSAALARRNVAHIARLGYVAGTREAAFKDAIAGVPKGQLPGRV